MSNNKSFPTMYQNISDTELHCMFHSSVWFGNEQNPGLTLDQKVDALQEIVNREAVQNNTKPVQVTAEDLNIGNTPDSGMLFGQYRPATDIIAVDVNLIDSGIISVPHHNENGQIEYVDVEVDASNLQSLVTTLHEYQHGVQEQSKTNPDIYDDKTMESNVHANMQVYFDKPHDLYSIQTIEKDANKVSIDRVQEILTVMEKHLGPEPGKQAFLEDCKEDSFDKALASATAKYGPNVEVELQNVINDIYHNNNISLDVSSTYISIYQEYYGVFSNSISHQTQQGIPTVYAQITPAASAVSTETVGTEATPTNGSVSNSAPMTGATEEESYNGNVGAGSAPETGSHVETTAPDIGIVDAPLSANDASDSPVNDDISDEGGEGIEGGEGSDDSDRSGGSDDGQSL